MCWLCSSTKPSDGLRELRVGGDFSSFGARKGQGYKVAPNTLAVPLEEKWNYIQSGGFPTWESEFFALIPFPNEEGEISPPSASYMMEIMGRKIRHRLRQVNAKVSREPNNNWLAEEKKELELRLKNSKAMVRSSMAK